MKIKLLKEDEIVISSSDYKKIEIGERYLTDKFHKEVGDLTHKETEKKPYRYDVINFLLESLGRDTNYLEIGVRNPEDNFKKINSTIKYSVDPGFENAENNVDFKVTSDVFFEKLSAGDFLDSQIRFDVIFIDGLHLAEQVERDIVNSLAFLKEDGYIVMHDCNPPSEFHASENYSYRLSPSSGYWNGTTWKAFFKARKRNDISCCCIDSDWGIGVISKSNKLGSSSTVSNDYYEYHVMEATRKESLNLVSFDEFKKIV